MKRSQRVSSEEIESVLITPRRYSGATYTYLQKVALDDDPGFSVGLMSLDKWLPGGVKRGEMVVIGGRPGTGKSFFINNVLEYNAQKGHTCLMVSAEMTATQLGARGFSNNTKIDSARLYAGEVPIDGDEWEKIKQAARVRADLPVYLIAHMGTLEKKARRRPRFTIDLVDATVQYLAERDVIVDIIGIDYLQRMKSSIGLWQRKDVADEVSGGSKDLALKWSAAVFIGTQLGRQVEERNTKLPHESDYKESGNIEEDGDTLMSIFAPMKYYSQGEIILGTTPERTAQPNQVFIQIHKQRGGPSGKSAWCWFDPRFAELRDLEERLAFDG